MRCLVILAAPLVAVAEDIQPDRLNFGRVHVGARVQGSVRIFVDPKAALEKKAEVTPPSFVRVDSVSSGTQDYGGNVKGFCDIAVTIDTTKVGEFASTIVMTLGGHRVEVPVAASIHARDTERPRILVANSPFQKFSTNDARMFDPWLKVVMKLDLDVDYLDVRGAKPVFDGINLAEFDGVLLGEMGLIGLKGDDLQTLRKFGDGGGCVIVTANAFMMGSVAKANEILVPYGLRMLDEENSDIKALVVQPPRIKPGPLTEGVRELSFPRASPSVLIDPDRTMIIVASPVERGTHLVAMALAGDQGRVVSLGVSLWWLWLGQADNAVLFGNLMPRRHRAK